MYAVSSSRASPLALLVLVLACGNGSRTNDDAGIDAGDSGVVMHRLAIDNEGGGRVSGGAIDCGVTCAAWFPVGTVVVLEATPRGANVFGGWAGDCSGTGSCSIVIDSDRRIGAVFTPPTFSWTLQLGGEEGEEPASVAVDAAGNVLVAGQFRGTVNLGGQDLMAAGESDVFLAKFTAMGAHLWSIRGGGDGFDRVAGVAAAASGDVVVAGTFEGSAEFGGPSLQSEGGVDVFVARYDTDGVARWSMRRGGPDIESVAGVAVSPMTDDILIAGGFRGAIDLGIGTVGAVGMEDVFLAAYAGADGSHADSRTFGSAGEEIVVGLAATADGVVVTGYFLADVDLGGGPLPATSTLGNLFVARYDGAFNHVWSRSSGGTFAFGVATQVDPNGDVLVAGLIDGDVDLGGGILPSAVGVDAVVAKYSGSNGAHIWSRAVGGVFGEDLGSDALAVNQDGDALLVGVFGERIEIGAEEFVSVDVSDLFATTLRGSDGEPMWARRFGNDGDAFERMSGTAALDDGWLVAGAFQGVGDFGGAYLTSRGATDVVLMRIVE